MRFLLILFLTLNLLQAKKIANSNYTHLDKLYSPQRDIPALAKKLRKIGFDVEADGIKVEWIAQKMPIAKTNANILFLDACRDVPIGIMGGTKDLGQVKRQPLAIPSAKR